MVRYLPAAEGLHKALTASSVTDFVYNALHVYQDVESYPMNLVTFHLLFPPAAKANHTTVWQSEYTADAQGSVADQPSINNTCTCDLDFAVHHYPPLEPLEYGWNEANYGTKSHGEQQVASHCLYRQPTQSVCDNQYSTSNSPHDETHGYSKDHAPSQSNHAYVPTGMHIDISTGNGHDEHVEASVSFRLTADHDRMIQDGDQDQDGCFGMSHLSLHSERPPISSYSELSAHMLYYDSQNSTRHSKSGSSSPSTSVSVTTQECKPLKSATTPPDWQASRSEGTTTLMLQTLLPSSRTSTLEVWAPPTQVKTEERSPPLQSRRKRLSSPSSSTLSSSIESRWSRTLSPSSRSQGAMKTIMMKRVGLVQKQYDPACLFCRERKIACGRPPQGSDDRTCNQCSRRSLECRYPMESRRGQHKRNAKKGNGNGHDVNRAK
ncbi:hypothetical protein AX14_005518 [Amanita brunnescens Koide BX004]|nr:hypothetical protein AX14_005518 [Amanita brunnescens Koide BX004]